MGSNLRAVELDEDDAQPERSPAEPAPRRRRGRRWALAGAAAGVVLALAAGQQVVDARHRVYLARFEHVPGVIRPVTRDPEPLWSLSMHPTGGVQVDGGIVVFEPSDGGLRLERLDPATGHVAWQVNVPAPLAPSTDEGDLEAGADCRATTGPHGAGDRVVCLASPISLDYLVDGGTPTEVRVLDARTGATVTRWRESVQQWALGGDRVLTASAAEHGTSRTWTVTARRLDGTVTWTRTLDWTVPEPTADGIGPGVTLQADADHALLSADGNGVVLDRAGGVAQTMGGDGMTGWSLARAGLLVRRVLRPSDDGPGAYTQDEFLMTDGAPPGQALVLTVDDGSAPDVALTTSSSGGVAAYDARSGRQLWRDDAVAAPQILLGGVVYTQSGTDLVALDVRTGSTVWSSRVGSVPDSLYTDGHVIYAQTTDRLRTFALADGASGPSWSTAQLALDPAAGRYLTAWNGVLTVAGAFDGLKTVVG